MKRGKLWFQVYQLAGMVVMHQGLTKGQRDRLETLLLDVTCEPDRYTARVVRGLVREALEP